MSVVLNPRAMLQRVVEDAYGEFDFGKLMRQCGIAADTATARRDVFRGIELLVADGQSLDGDADLHGAELPHPAMRAWAAIDPAVKEVMQNLSDTDRLSLRNALAKLGQQLRLEVEDVAKSIAQPGAGDPDHQVRE